MSLKNKLKGTQCKVAGRGGGKGEAANHKGTCHTLALLQPYSSHTRGGA